jgi:alpha-galactosidase
MRQKLIANFIFYGCFLWMIPVFYSCENRQDTATAAAQDTVPPINKLLAQKPPMGWNSWNCLGWGANESEVRAAADYMAANLKKLGYEYIVIDQLWYGDSLASNFEDFVHERISVKPSYRLDEFGRLLPDTIKYPSAKGSNGFKPLADYMHSLGLKFGVHLLRGIPWEAADKNLSIKGTGYKAAAIAQPGKGCDWYDGFYGVDMSKPGAQEYYNSVFKLFAEWGLDFVKADDMINTAEIEGMSKAARSSGRDIVLSVVPDDNIPISFLKENVHMARTGYDFWDVWQMLKQAFPAAAKAVKNAEPGFWPDLDILPVGKIGKKISYKGPDERIANFNESELHTLFSLWYISKAPLMIGGYLPETDSITLKLLNNEEALSANRTGLHPRQVKFKNAIIIWTADIENSDDKFLAFFNQWESKEPVDIKINWADLGLKDKNYQVRDLWSKKDLGNFENLFSSKIEAHGAGLYRIKAVSK